MGWLAYLISLAIFGLIVFKLLGAGPSALALAVCGAVFLMLSLDMLHPPASIGPSW